MKYLKKFNESKTGIEIDRDSINNLENSINNELFTPVKEGVPLKSLYKAIIVRTQYPINTKNVTSKTSPSWDDSGKVKIYDTNWVLLEYRSGSFGVSFYPDENSINRSLRSLGDFIYGQQMNLIIGYNDVNHAEIDNILSEYGIVADEIWGVPI
jgi:hypothetical protein